MYLPVFNKLESNQSTYITFSRALLDLDIAIVNDSEYYFSKMVAFNLPEYKVNGFSVPLKDIQDMSLDPKNIDGPNLFIPQILANYVENIIRNSDNPNISELALYKMLNKCGLSFEEIKERTVFVNQINTENFTKTEYNNGWGEIVMQIPNDSRKVNIPYKNVDIPNIILADVANDNDTGIFDAGLEKQFDFSTIRQVIDFDNITYDENTLSEFDFNCILVFYKDRDGVDKLHGINFVNNYINNKTEFILPKYTQRNNDGRSVGYLFKMNVKTCNNPASILQIQKINNSDAGHWSTYFTTLNKFNEFLEKHDTITLKQ